MSKEKAKGVTDVKEEQNTNFIVTLGIMAGDFWHCAAACILAQHKSNNNSKQHPFPDVNFVICVAVARDKSEWINGGRKMYEYFKKTGIPRVVVTIEGGNQQPDLNVTGLDGNNILKIWKRQKADGYTTDFNEIINKKSARANETGTGPSASEHLLRYDTGTSVLMQLTQYLGVSVAQNILATRMSQPVVLGSVSDEAENPAVAEQREITEAVEERMQELKGVITRARNSYLKRYGAKAKVLIFNYRYTDYNYQHNANRSILDQVKALARAHDTIVVVIPAMEDRFLRTEIKADDHVFYIFDRPTGRLPYKHRLTYLGRAAFWASAARELQLPTGFTGRMERHRCVIGMMGGRSGSMDLPAFVGLRCLSWDEPLFQVKEAQRVRISPPKFSLPSLKPEAGATSASSSSSSGKAEKRKTTDTTKGEKKQKKDPSLISNWTSKWLQDQGRQILRLLNQKDLMHVSFLDRDTLTVERGSRVKRLYSLLDASDPRLQIFLGTLKSPIFSLGTHAIPDWSEYVIGTYRQVLERKNIASGVNVIATNLDKYTLLARIEQGDEDAKDNAEELSAVVDELSSGDQAFDRWEGFFYDLQDVEDEYMFAMGDNDDSENPYVDDYDGENKSDDDVDSGSSIEF